MIFKEKKFEEIPFGPLVLVKLFSVFHFYKRNTKKRKKIEFHFVQSMKFEKTFF